MLLKEMCSIQVFLSYWLCTQKMKLVSIFSSKFPDRKRGKRKFDEEELFEDLSFILQMLKSLITGEFEGLGMLFFI